MHGPIRENLEDLLGKDTGHLPLREHLESCPECFSELQQMNAQCLELRALRAPDQLQVEPAAGFYARVLQRIEEREIDSIWSFFFESSFSRGLAVGSLGIVLALGSYVISQKRPEPAVAQSIVALNGAQHYDEPVMGSQAEQRDAVLDNFAEHLPGTQGQIR